MTSIDDRPTGAAGRQVPGHWEGDLVIGKAGQTALASLVERTSRSTEIIALPKGKRDAQTTCDSLAGAVQDMPSPLLKSLTWDQGTEMAGHAAFTLATGSTRGSLIGCIGALGRWNVSPVQLGKGRAVSIVSPILYDMTQNSQQTTLPPCRGW
jgi:hypothetical protein